MPEGSRATLDHPMIRGNVRRDFIRQSYEKRRNKDLRSSLLHDIIIPYKKLPQPIEQPVKEEAPISTQSTKLYAREPVQVPSSYYRYNVAYKPTFTVGFRSKLFSKITSALRSGQKNKLHTALIAIAMVMLASGAYISLMSLRANHVAQVQAAKLTQEANRAQRSSSSSALSTVKPTGASLAAYTVPPNDPRYLKIPSLGVDAAVLSVGVTSSGALATPPNVYETAWYNKSALPGQQGATLIDGHISSWTAHGVFYGLKNLKPGDSMQIVTGGGTIYNYHVVKTQLYPDNSVNMQAAVTPIVAGTPGLNLISCAGDVIPGTSLFNERIIVFAEQVGS